MIKKFLLITGLSTTPLYVLPSGNLQPSDFAFALFAGFVFFELLVKQRPLKGGKILTPWLLLAVWILAVQLVWIFREPKLGFIHPLFYIYNFIVSAAIIQFFAASPNGIETMRTGVKLGLTVSGLGVVLNILFPTLLLGEESFGRITGFFNNPNQLSHFSLCMLGLLFVLQKFKLSMSPFALLAMSGGVLGVLAPTSLAGMAGLFALSLALIAANWRSIRKASRILVILVFLPLVLVVVDWASSGVISDRLQSRFDRLDRKIDDIYSERNYDRILAFPEYWILGAGEGETFRFHPYDGGEIHSSLGNLFFSYGLVALFLFGIIVLRCLRFAPLPAWLVFLAPMLYGLTHMGLRTTVFWLLLVAIWLVYDRSLARGPSPRF